MKKVSLATFIIALLVIFEAHCFQTLDSNPPKQGLSPGYYIVIAAYKSHQEDFAQKYSEKLERDKIASGVGFDPSRNLYYVYLSVFEDFSQSIKEMKRARASTSFTDAWVRVLRGSQTDTNLPRTSINSKVITTNTEVSKIEQIAVGSGISKTAKDDAQSTSAVIAKAPDQLTMVTTSTETEVIPNPIPAPIFYPQTLRTTPAFLSIYNPRNGKLIDSEVEVVDTDMNRLITRVKGNSYVQLPDPKNKSGRLTLIASPFGYRKVQNVISFRNTEADTLLPHVDMIGNFYLIKFDMVRYHPGDLVTLYNVYFFNDAAIMLPESRYELNTLLEMLNENPGYRIKLHGHTNGNGRGKIISMGPSKEFFKITSDAIESVGSAKELSGARATVIKDWLVANGVSESRIEIKAWGGDRMIHDRNGTNARRNVRVEVEVLEE